MHVDKIIVCKETGKWNWAWLLIQYNLAVLNTMERLSSHQFASRLSFYNWSPKARAQWPELTVTIFSGYIKRPQPSLSWAWQWNRAHLQPCNQSTSLLEGHNDVTKWRENPWLPRYMSDCQVPHRLTKQTCKKQNNSSRLSCLYFVKARGLCPNMGEKLLHYTWRSHNPHSASLSL